MIAKTPAFRFRRYREEVVFRSSLQQPTDTENKRKASFDNIVEHVPATNRDNRSRSRASTETDNNGNDNDGGDGTVVENLVNVIIVIDLYGKVLTKKKNSPTKTIESNDQSDNSIPTENDEIDITEQREPICIVPEGTTLLLRNLRDCHVVIHLPLPAVHFVGIEDTEIIFYNKSKDCSKTHDNDSSEDLSHTATTSTSTIEKNTSANANANTTIHMTDCRGRSSLQLETSAQQLRIHQSIGLRVKMMNESVAKMITRSHHPALASMTTMPSCDWKPGTIILEASKGIVFSVPPLAEATPANQSQQERDQEVSAITTTATTKTYWHQVIVKDFQWLRKGIASPNFQIEVLVVSNDGSNKDKNSSEESTETLARTRNTLLHRNSNTEELEYGNNSDSEDEL